MVGNKAEYKIDPHSPFEGILMLSPNEKHPKGYSFAEKVAKMDLQAELVCMSACYSGVGRKQKDGNIGLPWAFHVAGALSVVATY